MTYGLFKTALAIGTLIQTIIYLGFIGGLTYVAWHFVHKLW